MLPAFLSVPPIFALAAAGALILLGLLIWGARNRLVWRVLAVLGMGAGVAFLVWGILLASLGEEAPLIAPAAMVAIGAGALTSSITLLVISFLGGGKP